ncbi:hypothetical protein N665_0553s0002 [Sinapis alba]|nr:hypothetical protein N665_0553s0002 [Sinapis alba]
MAPKNRFSREEKGKALASELSLVRNETGAESPLDDFNLIHRDALMDTASLSLSQRILVAEAASLFRGECKGQAASDDGSDGEEEIHSIDTEERPSEEHPENEEPSSEEHVEPVDFYPICFYPGGIFERQDAIPSDQLRPLISTVGSVKRLFRECGASGVTFLIPNDEQQPWTPSLGYQCGYESYFRKDTKLWFPIPWLITSYCFRRDVAISQFINGSFRIAVALMMMAAEGNISMSVHTFEEQTKTQPRPQGLFFVKIITGHPNKTENWNHYYFYVNLHKFAFEEPLKDDYRVLCNNNMVIHPNTIAYPEKFFENAQAIATFSHLRWPDISRERICRVLEWISREMRKMPDLSALIGGELSASRDNPMAILDGMNFEAPVTDLISSLAVPQNPEECKGDDVDGDGGALVRRKRKRSKDDLPSERNGNDGQDAPSEERPKRRKKKSSSERQQGTLTRETLIRQDAPEDEMEGVPEEVEDASREAVDETNLLRKTHAKFSDRVSFCYFAGAPLISDVHSCAELVYQIKGDPWDMPQVRDLVFADAYIDVARSSVLGQCRMNLVVLEYDRALKHTIASLKMSEESLAERNSYIAKKKKEFKDISTSAIKERDKAISRRKAERKKDGELSAELDTARARIFRSHEVTLERVQNQTAMIAKSNCRFTNTRDYMASGTKKYLELVRDKGTPIPQDVIDVGQEAWELEVGEIPESNL